MTKIMTSIIAFELIEKGDLNLTTIYISEMHEIITSWLFIYVHNGW